MVKWLVTGTFYVSWILISLISITSILDFHPVLNEIQVTWVLIGLIYLGVLFSPIETYMEVPELNAEVSPFGTNNCFNVSISGDTR